MRERKRRAHNEQAKVTINKKIPELVEGMGGYKDTHRYRNGLNDRIKFCQTKFNELAEAAGERSYTTPRNSLRSVLLLLLLHDSRLNFLDRIEVYMFNAYMFARR